MNIADEDRILALLDQMDATARDLTLLFKADAKCDLLAQDFLDAARNPFAFRRYRKARALDRHAHQLFMAGRYQEVLDQ